MPQEILRQSNWNGGVLDPKMRGRREFKGYAAAAEVLENIVPTPQGSLTRRPGSDFVDLARHLLEDISLVGVTVTAPNGGTAADAATENDVLVTTVTDLNNTNPYVVLHYDFGAPQTVALVDVIDIATDGGPGNVLTSLAVQYSTDNAAWSDFGARLALGTIVRSRRFGIGPRREVTARYWRVAKVGGLNWAAATISLDAVAFWREAANLSPMRYWSFARNDAADRYLMVATDYNFEVYRNDVRLASIAMPHTEDDVRLVTTAQALDTLLAFHADAPPRLVTRQGAHGEWDSRPATFSNIPKYDFDNTHPGGVNEVQKLLFVSFSNGDLFNIALEGETTGAIVYSNVGATTAAHITTALETLPSVGVGNVAVASLSATEFTVTFQGALGYVDLAEMAPITVSSAAGGVFASTSVQGDPGGEAMMSAGRGWPACGGFYLQRLWLGGLRSRPQTLIASRIGSHFDFNINGATAAAGISADLDTNQETTIKALFPGQHLQIFTTSTEFHVLEPITNPPSVKPNTSLGLLAGTAPANLDGATAFVSRAGGALMEFQFDDSRQKYVAAPLSLLSSHLMGNVVDFAFRPSNGDVNRIDLGIMAKADGTATVMTALRSQDVVGFAPWTTDGAWLCGVGDLAGDVWLGARRVSADGVEENFVEHLNEGAMLDCQVEMVSDGDPITELTGLGHFEGQLVTLYIDGADGGDVLVTDAKAVLPWPALRKVAGGRHFIPRGRLLPAILEEDPRGGASMRARVGNIDFRLGPTAGLKAGLVDGRQWTVPLKRTPAIVADEGEGETPFTGWTRLWAVPGFRMDAQMEFSQPRPGPLEIQEIVLTVQS